MSWFSKKKTETNGKDVKLLSAPERLQQFVLAMDEAAKAITTSAHYLRTANFRYSADDSTPYTEYLEALYIPAKERWSVQKVVLHEMLLPGSGVDKTSAVSSITPEAEGLNYFETVHRLAVYEQSQQALQRVEEINPLYYYKDIAHNDQIAFNIYGIPGRTVAGRMVGKDTYSFEEVALMQRLEDEREAKKAKAKESTALVKRIDLPPPTLQTNLGALSEIFVASQAKSETDPKRMVALIETQGALHQIRHCIRLGVGIWTGGKLEGFGPYAFQRSFDEAEFGKQYDDNGDDMNRWSLRGPAYAKYFRALKLAESTAQQHAWAVRDYPDLRKIMYEAAIASQSLLIMWLAQTTRQEWSGQYALNNEANKKEIFGAPEEQGKIGTLTKEVAELHRLIDDETADLDRKEQEDIRKSIPNLLRPITLSEFETPLLDVCKKLKAIEKQLRDYANQTIEHAIQPPESVLALPAPQEDRQIPPNPGDIRFVF